MKTCTKCETEYDDTRSNFYYRPESGFTSWCKTCMGAAAKSRQRATRALGLAVPPLLLRLIDLDIECLTNSTPPADMLPQLLELRADVAALCGEDK